MKSPNRTSRHLLARTVLLLMVWALLGVQPVAAWEDRPANLNFDFVQEAVPDVVIDDPDVDLQAYLEQQLGRAVSAYSTPLIIPGAAFNADSQSSPYFFSFANGSLNSAGSGCFMVPVYLPHGATVNNFFIFAYDNAASDITFNMWRKRTTTTDAPTVMAAVTTSGASTSIQILGDTSVDDPIVSSDYAYYVTHCFLEATATQRIQALWIYYTEP
jgi:hypothetical protein